MKSKFLTVLMILIIFMECFYIVYAAKSDELKGDLNDKNNEIDAKTEEIEQNQEKLNAALAEVESLEDQIDVYENAISDLMSQISSVQSQISEKETNIALKQKEYEETKELFEKRLVAIYQSGDTSYLELMLSSQDLSDFISKYYLVSELATCDKNLIERIFGSNDKNYMECSIKKLRDRLVHNANDNVLRIILERYEQINKDIDDFIALFGV